MGRPGWAGRGALLKPERLPQRISCQPRLTPQPPTSAAQGASGGASTPAPGCAPFALTYLSRGQRRGWGGKGQLAPLLAGCLRRPHKRGPPRPGAGDRGGVGGGWRGLDPHLGTTPPACLALVRGGWSTQLRGGGPGAGQQLCACALPAAGPPSCTHPGAGLQGTATELTLVGTRDPLPSNPGRLWDWPWDRGQFLLKTRPLQTQAPRALWAGSSPPALSAEPAHCLSFHSPALYLTLKRFSPHTGAHKELPNPPGWVSTPTQTGAPRGSQGPWDLWSSAWQPAHLREVVPLGGAALWALRGRSAHPQPLALEAGTTPAVDKGGCP